MSKNGFDDIFLARNLLKEIPDSKTDFHKISGIRFFVFTDTPRQTAIILVR